MSGIYEDYLDITNRAEQQYQHNAAISLDDEDFPLFFHSNNTNADINTDTHNNNPILCKNNNTTCLTTMPSPKTHIRKISHHAEDQEDDADHTPNNNNNNNIHQELCTGDSSSSSRNDNSSCNNSSSSNHVKHVSVIHSPSNSMSSSNMSRSGMCYSPIHTPKTLNGTTRKYNQSKASASIPSFALLPNAPTQSFDNDNTTADDDDKGQYYDHDPHVDILAPTVTNMDETRAIIMYSTLNGGPVYEPMNIPSTHVEQKDLSELDVLCGRGGGTNSWIGNRRYRAVVQSYQPTYLKAKRKEKPMLAREIVSVIRSNGGRFLKKMAGDQSASAAAYYEDIGDYKAEAKTAQALREGLDVRATNAAASNLLFPKAYAEKKLLSPSSSRSSNANRRGKQIIVSSFNNPGVSCFSPHVGPSLPTLLPASQSNVNLYRNVPVNNNNNTSMLSVKRTRFKDDGCDATTTTAANNENVFEPPLSPATKRMRAEYQQQEQQQGYHQQQQGYLHYEYRGDNNNNNNNNQQQRQPGGGVIYHPYGVQQQHQQQHNSQFTLTPGQFEYWSPQSWDQEDEDSGVHV